MIDLRDENVNHKIWGIGTVIEQTEKSIVIHFSIGDKQFQYPEAFESFLTCSDKQNQEKVLSELKCKRQKAYDDKINAQKEREKALAVFDTTPKKTIGKKSYAKENIAFKCNFCDGGCKENGIGYRAACSDKLINYNIEEAHHNWCCDENSPCSQYYNGIIDRETLDSYNKGSDFICYESQMLRNWSAFAGYALTKEDYQRPLKLNKVQTNSLAILTTREPYSAEKDRFVFAVFLVDEAYEGDNREQGYVTTSSKYKLSLTNDEAKKILFWNYYHNENAPEKTAWGQGLHRYITDIQAASILHDIVTLKVGKKDEALAKELLEHFCRLNNINISDLPVLEGALSKTNNC